MIALRKRQETLLVIFLALGLSFLLWMVVENASWFTANVAGPVVEFDETTDVVTYVTDSQVRIVAGKTIPDVRSLSMILSYDSEVVTLEASDIDTPASVSFAAGDPGYATLVLDSMTDFSQGETLVTIDLEGDAHALVISDVVITFGDGSTEQLAVSTL